MAAQLPAFVAIAPQDATLRLNDENTECRWCSLEEAKAIAPFPNQKALYEYVWTHFVLSHVNGGVKVYRWGGAKVYQLAHDGLMLF